MNRWIATYSFRRWQGWPPAALAVTLVLAGGCRSSAPVVPSVPPPSQVPIVARPPGAPIGESAPTESPKVYKNTVKWATASEVDNFGYDVYRSESEDGPFERINAEVIEGAGTTDEPTRYQFPDDAIDPRKTYYYYVESISMSGVRERFTPIGKVLPKIPAAQDEEAAGG